LSTSLDVLGGVTQGAAYKPPCAVATLTDLTNVMIGLPVIDGYQVQANDRVLVKNNANQTTNGIYVAQLGAWQRSLDFTNSSTVMAGTQVFVFNGATQANSIWVVQEAVTFGTTNITFSQQFTGQSTSVSYPSIAALQAILPANITPSQIVQVDGYFAAGDGGGSRFLWSATSTATPDGGTVFQPNTMPAAGRWLRITGGYYAATAATSGQVIVGGHIYLKYFGCKIDGVTDDTTAFNSAVAYANANAYTKLLGDAGTCCITALNAFTGTGCEIVSINGTNAFNILHSGNNAISWGIAGTNCPAYGGMTDVGINNSGVGNNISINMPWAQFLTFRGLFLGTGVGVLASMGVQGGTQAVNIVSEIKFTGLTGIPSDMTGVPLFALYNGVNFHCENSMFYNGVDATSHCGIGKKPCLNEHRSPIFVGHSGLE
jgi:hypothetical protein